MFVFVHCIVFRRLPLSGSLVQGNLYGSYICFTSQRQIWTASSLSVLKAVWCKINKIQSLMKQFRLTSILSRLRLSNGSH